MKAIILPLSLIHILLLVPCLSFAARTNLSGYIWGGSALDLSAPTLWQDVGLSFDAEMDVARDVTAKLGVDLSSLKRPLKATIGIHHSTYGVFQLGHHGIYPLIKSVSLGQFDAFDREFMPLWCASAQQVSKDTFYQPCAHDPAYSAQKMTEGVWNFSYFTPRIFGLKAGYAFGVPRREVGVPTHTPQPEGVVSVGLNMMQPLYRFGINTKGGLIKIAGAYQQISLKTPTYSILGETPENRGNYIFNDHVHVTFGGAWLRLNQWQGGVAYQRQTMGKGAPEITNYGFGSAYKIGKWMWGIRSMYTVVTPPDNADVMDSVQSLKGADLIYDLAGQPIGVPETYGEAKEYVVSLIERFPTHQVNTYDKKHVVKTIRLTASYTPNPHVKLAAGITYGMVTVQDNVPKTGLRFILGVGVFF